MEPSLALIIPAHNEQGAIGKTIAGIKQLVLPRTINVCDNASSDNTALEVELAGAVVQREPLKGKGQCCTQAAPRYGCRHLRISMAIDCLKTQGFDLLTGDGFATAGPMVYRSASACWLRLRLWAWARCCSRRRSGSGRSRICRDGMDQLACRIQAEGCTPFNPRHPPRPLLAQAAQSPPAAAPRPRSAPAQR